MNSFSFGASLLGRPLPGISHGCTTSTDQLVITASIHGREYINTELLSHFCRFLDSREEFLIKEDLCVYTLPLLNPDGVIIAKEIHPRFRGNYRGIDLNRNFPYGFHPSPASGQHAGSEPETVACMNFINELSNPLAVIHYHSCGNLIYWDYQVESSLHEKLYHLALLAKKSTGYRMVPFGPSTAPNGGFGDWCVYEKKIPTITIETGCLFAPVPHYQFRGILRRNLRFLSSCIEQVKGVCS